MLIRLFNIGWNVTDNTGNDVDGNYYNLPDDVIIENPSSELLDAAKRTLETHEAAEELEDYLSDKYEFCVFEFSVEILNSPKELDAYLEEKWDELTDVPFSENEAGELILEESWFMFDKATSREEIWHWFDKRHSKGVAWLLYEFEKEV